jgi:hypothetical protein
LVQHLVDGANRNMSGAIARLTKQLSQHHSNQLVGLVPSGHAENIQSVRQSVESRLRGFVIFGVMVRLGAIFQVVNQFPGALTNEFGSALADGIGMAIIFRQSESWD